jgi:hypothetical protein
VRKIFLDHDSPSANPDTFGTPPCRRAGVETPSDFSDWMSVAAGESEDYDANGAPAMIR